LFQNYIIQKKHLQEKILSFAFDPSIYIFSERLPVSNSTEFLYVGSPYILTDEDQYSAIELIKQNNIKYIIVTKYIIVDGKSLLSPLIYEFIINNYTKVDSAEPYEIYLITPKD